MTAPLLSSLLRSILAGKAIDRETARQLVQTGEPTHLWQAADTLRQDLHGNRFHLCSIINARSGNCSEDCRFCAQSARHHTTIPRYRLIDPDKALLIARDNDRHGVDRLSLVTSGRSVDADSLGRLAALYGEIRARTGLRFCASMGLLTKTGAIRLREAGVSRYHCNLESSREYFPMICTTHSWEDKVSTLQIARQAGLSLCSGGIIGLGETMDDRIDLAFELRELDIRSIPLNIHTPIPGTPLADLPTLPIDEVLTTIALFRLINPQAVIRLAGGRQLMGNNQYRCFRAGANGAIVGNYLTTVGVRLERDLEELRALGFTFRRNAGCRDSQDLCLSKN